MIPMILELTLGYEFVIFFIVSAYPSLSVE